MDRDAAARGLAGFGVGLGLLELAPRAVARWSGLEGREGVLRLFGVREIASGLVILASKSPRSWLWLRTAGDAADAALLASRSTPSSPAPARALAATALVLPVVVLDALYTFAPDLLD